VYSLCHVNFALNSFHRHRPIYYTARIYILICGVSYGSFARRTNCYVTDLVSLHSRLNLDIFCVQRLSF
jgi:hypothetical protein